MEVVYGGHPNPIAIDASKQDKLSGLTDAAKFEQLMFEQRTNNFKYVMHDYNFVP